MLQRPLKGTYDVLPGQSRKWQYIEKYIPGDLQKLRN